MAIEKYGAKRMVCPECGSTSIFKINTTGSMTVFVDGEGEIDDVDTTSPHITSSDRCQGLICGYVNDFCLFEKPVGESNA